MPEFDQKMKKQEIKPGAVVIYILEYPKGVWNTKKEMTVVGFDPQNGLRLEDGEGSIHCCIPGFLMFRLICDAIQNKLNRYVSYEEFCYNPYSVVESFCKL